MINLIEAMKKIFSLFLKYLLLILLIFTSESFPQNSVNNDSISSQTINWKRDLKTKHLLIPTGPFYHDPLYLSNGLIVVFTENSLEAIDIRSGDTEWTYYGRPIQYPDGSELRFEKNINFGVMGPVFEDSKSLYVHYESKIDVIDIHTGKLINVLDVGETSLEFWQRFGTFLSTQSLTKREVLIKQIFNSKNYFTLLHNNQVLFHQERPIIADIKFGDISASHAVFFENQKFSSRVYIINTSRIENTQHLAEYPFRISFLLLVNGVLIIEGRNNDGPLIVQYDLNTRKRMWNKQGELIYYENNQILVGDTPNFHAKLVNISTGDVALEFKNIILNRVSTFYDHYVYHVEDSLHKVLNLNTGGIEWSTTIETIKYSKQLPHYSPNTYISFDEYLTINKSILRKKMEPKIIGKYIITVIDDHKILCINNTNGKIEWEYGLPNQFIYKLNVNHGSAIIITLPLPDSMIENHLSTQQQNNTYMGFLNEFVQHPCVPTCDETGKLICISW